MNGRLLEVNNLQTHFFVRRGIVKAVDGVSFKIDKGKVLGLVGESGCGKSVTAMSILRLIPSPPGKIVGGEILFRSEDESGNEEEIDLLKLSLIEIRKFRGKRISVVLQDPMTSLNPVFTIGNQVGEPFRLHEKLSGPALLKKIIEVLKRVRIPNPDVRIADYPHQFSGGMRQRVSTAMGISCNPQLLIADEPTTALDVTIQAQLLKLFEQVQQESNMAIILITHNLGIVARLCDRVCVMYAGRIVEDGSVRRIFKEPAHPYTRALMESVPRLGKKKRLFSIEGQPPNLLFLPTGCSFWPRCSFADEKCKQEYPPITSIEGDDYVRCWQYSGGTVS
ncbi:MAG: ABC transporter ATP-binding protein [Deltaproteobacteria bacterium]|nr:ABC transporter ATP-binding protein [Deltaproteobacteria bacterium]MBW2141226.1 ABC transporter ATP-binding protein [Deltaproteobacteria bacterium]MBW2323608.1 ABC transporter ATP-binding protein [Deltaproteobacteria bacterium]